jgi:hypothetical protein
VARNVKAVRPFVNVRDPQAFALGIGFGEAAGEKGLGRREAVKFQRVFGTLIPHRQSVYWVSGGATM